MTGRSEPGSADDRDLHPKQPRAIHSALVVLEEVARSRPGVTVRELVDRLGLPRATVYRLVNLLVQEEYLVRLADISGLALGRKVAELAGSLGLVPGAPATRVPRAGRELLAGLRAASDGLAVHLLGYETGRPVPLDPDPLLPLHDPAGMREDPQRSAAGRLWLADTPGRPAEAGGLAVQSDLLVPGSACAAVAVRTADGALLAALCVSGPSTRIAAILRRAESLGLAADRLSALLD